MIDNGYGDVVELANAHLEIDTHAIKTTALSVYGLLEQAHHDLLPPNLNLLSLFTPEPNSWILRNSPSTYALEELSLEIHDRMLEYVGREWEGDAYDRFKEHSEALRSVIRMEAERLRTIGSALFHVASAIEKANEEAEITFWGAVGIVETLTSVRDVALTGSGVLGLAAGLLIGEMQNAEAEAAKAAELAEFQAGNTITISDPQYMRSSPEEELRNYRYPKDPGKWHVDED